MNPNRLSFLKTKTGREKASFFPLISTPTFFPTAHHQISPSLIVGILPDRFVRFFNSFHSSKHRLSSLAIISLPSSIFPTSPFIFRQLCAPLYHIRQATSKHKHDKTFTNPIPSPNKTSLVSPRTPPKKDGDQNIPIPVPPSLLISYLTIQAKSSTLPPAQTR